MADDTLKAIQSVIRDVPDFPKPGIIFKDITPLLMNAKLLTAAVQRMAGPYHRQRVTRVVAIESRGFLLGAPIAVVLGAGLVPIRKPGKLPAARERVEYALEYGTDAMEMHSDALVPGDRVLVVDDVLATGGTAQAARRLVQSRQVELLGFSFLIELMFLGGRKRLGDARIEALLQYS